MDPAPPHLKRNQFRQGRRPRPVRGDPRRPSPERRLRPPGDRFDRLGPPPNDILPHGIRRSGDRRAQRRTRPRTVPHDRVRIRRAVDAHPDHVQQPVLHVPEAGQLDQEGLVRPVPVRGREQEVHDAPHRLGVDQGFQIQEVRRYLRQGSGHVLRGLLESVQKTGGIGHRQPESHGVGLRNRPKCFSLMIVLPFPTLAIAR